MTEKFEDEGENDGEGGLLKRHFQIGSETKLSDEKVFVRRFLH